jgi:hypothetical protein
VPSFRSGIADYLHEHTIPRLVLPELLEGGIQVPQGFLWGTLGDRVQPGDLGLLEGIELAVQRDGGGALLGRLIPFLLDLQA